MHARRTLPKLEGRLRSFLVADRVQAFGEFALAALFEKVLFQPAELLVDEVVGLMNEADGHVGDDGRGRVSTNWR